MNIASEDIKDMIVASGYGTFGTDLFISYMPETPDLCVEVRDIDGMSPELNYSWEIPYVRVMVRGAKGGYTTASTRIKNIADYLHGRQEIRNGAEYKLISQDGEVYQVGNDKNNRPILAVRFMCQRSEE